MGKPLRRGCDRVSSRPSSRRAVLVAVLMAMLLTSCGDSDEGGSIPPLAPPTTAAVMPDADVVAAFAASIVAGDQFAAAAVATADVVALLEPWDPFPGAVVFEESGSTFGMILETENNIECIVATGLVQSCRFLVPGGDAVERLSFPPGEYGTFVSGGVVRDERAVYLLGAAEGQSMIVTVTSVESNAVFDVFSPSGQLLALEETNRAVLLFEDGEHEIVVGSTRGNTTFDLDVYVFDAERVRFAGGTTGTTLSDSVVRTERAVYVLEAAGGQTLEVTITSLEDNAVVDVYGPTGPPLATESTGFQIVLPESGLHQIVAAATRGNATYDLSISVVGP